MVESGEPREVHHFATLIGYGAAAINPYVMFETLDELADEGWLPEGMTRRGGRRQRAIKGDREGAAEDDLEDGHLDDLVLLRRADLRGGRARAGAVERALHRHAVADRRHRRSTCSRARRSTGTRAPTRTARASMLPLGGVYAWRRDGEHHMWNPETIALLQHAVRHGGAQTYEEYSQLVNEDAARKATLRGLLKFRFAEDGGIPLEEVEPAKEIVKRFSTGAMSLGSLGREAHETLAIAMNRIGGKSNTGEGGEDPVRYIARRRTATRAARRSSRSPRAASA